MDAHLKDRLAFLGSLASGLAHEIKNPLSTMTITLGLLREDFEDAESQRERRVLRKVQLLESEVVRLEKILQDFLQFAGGHAVRPELVDPNLLVGDLLEFFEPSCRDAGLSLRRQFSPSLPQVLVDRELIKQALLNLLTNARQAMPDGGELMVHTSTTGDRVRIDVVDTGVGIPPEALDRIFEVYFSTKASGTGLGLPTVRRILLEHGGDVEVDSEVGRGTCVSVFLPVPPTIVGHTPLRLPGSRDLEGADLATVLAPPEDRPAEGTSDPDPTPLNSAEEAR
jgi:signal transduction histidine kinase